MKYFISNELSYIIIYESQRRLGIFDVHAILDVVIIGIILHIPHHHHGKGPFSTLCYSTTDFFASDYN